MKNAGSNNDAIKQELSVHRKEKTDRVCFSILMVYIWLGWVLGVCINF